MRSPARTFGRPGETNPQEDSLPRSGLVMAGRIACMPRLLFAAFLLLAAMAAFSGSPAHAEKRVALVIGNSAYQHAVQLPNPVNDAKLMADTLRGLGFFV